jgi:hypothetical protein
VLINNAAVDVEHDAVSKPGPIVNVSPGGAGSR